MDHHAVHSRETRTAMWWLLVIGVLQFMQWPGQYLFSWAVARLVSIDSGYFRTFQIMSGWASMRSIILGLLAHAFIGLMMYRRSGGQAAWVWLAAGVLLGPLAAAVWIAVRASEGVRGAGLRQLRGDTLPALGLIFLWCLMTVAPFGVLPWVPGWYGQVLLLDRRALTYAVVPLLLSTSVPMLTGIWLFVVARREERAAWVWLALGLVSGVAAAALYYISRLYDRGEDVGHGFQVVPMATVAAESA